MTEITAMEQKVKENVKKIVELRKEIKAIQKETKALETAIVVMKVE